QQTLNILDDIHELTDSEVTELARRGSSEMASQILPACFNELARRVNAWLALRHSPEQAFAQLSDQLLSASALLDRATLRRTLNYVRGFKKREPHVSRFIRLLANRQNIEGLQLVRKTLARTKWKAHRRLIYDALMRAAIYAGAEVTELVPVEKEPLSV